MTLPMRRGRYGARRWDPFAGFGGFDDLFDQMSRMLTTAYPDVARISINSWSPPVDVQDADDAFLVEADMPGVRQEDVTVDLQRNELRITGQYGGEEEAEGKRTRRSGRFDYRVTLPAEVDAEQCSAELDNGVLRLRMPKISAGRQRIPVQRGPSEQAIETGAGGEQGTGGEVTSGGSRTTG